jgi:hypothetical protein
MGQHVQDAAGQQGICHGRAHVEPFRRIGMSLGDELMSEMA